jgi:hypothetical protein
MNSIKKYLKTIAMSILERDAQLLERKSQAWGDAARKKLSPMASWPLVRQHH